ncbi:hypothetical protein Rleg9DRAFT_1742 [Rhizobium leguminosarum bv. trifolii WSM597]|uniref:GcrA cell cycle regulator n=1 Tax=Rhizobium leguminosarum bv. trifolii WSM597 TaxID=754764 RepID=I9N8A2_RHILT|nr:GcrA family cell cycle regulator [Rhizobium leguminosarum]EJB02927.1 hypothetical protein Rleg9DRAFT_1742 [Rhizobium leguminosarum bv. trifolii WSM597]
MNAYPEWSSLDKQQRVAAIRPLAASGLSATVIANRFRGVTRNAIIGYCTRNDIVLGKGQRSPAKKPVVGVAPKVDREKKKPAPDIIALGPIAKRRAFDPIEGVTPVSLENLGARQCHWPVNGFNGHEPIFCGGAASNLYCASHTRLAYSPHGH